MDALPEHLCAAVSEAVETRFGLDFPKNRWIELERAIQLAAEEEGYATASAYAADLLCPTTSAARAVTLAHHLTIPETYFFREPAVLDTLARFVAREIRDGRRAGAPLRVWSAGCCSGEEAYSFAIVIREQAPETAGRVSIIGTDVNARYVEAAKAGIYREWSFRGTSAGRRQRWFRPIQGKHFEIAPEVREAVTFQTMNLTEADYSRLIASAPFDVILCRNVLMHFSDAQQERTIMKLKRCLAPGGLLVVSAAEMSPLLAASFERNLFPGLPIFRKATTMKSAAAAASRPATTRNAPAPLIVKPSSPAARRDATGGFPARARSLADAGDFNGALVACDRAIADDRMTPQHHFLRALILQEQNRLDDAVAALKRALYADHGFVMAVISLGQLCFRRGAPAEGLRQLQKAKAILASLPPNAIVPEADGLTASGVIALVQILEGQHERDESEHGHRRARG